MTAELATLPTARLVRPLVLRWPSCLARPSRFADSARATHAPRARATGRTPLTHCSSSSLCTCSRRGGSTSRWRSWTSRRRSSRAAACRKRPLGAGATAWPLAGGDARCRSGLLYARTHPEPPRARQPPPLLVWPHTFMALPSARANGAHFPPFPIQDPGADRVHGATHRGRELLPDPRRRGNWHPLPRGARPPYPDVGAAPVAAVLVLSVVGTPCNL